MAMTSPYLQMPLLQPEPLVPLPVDSSHYVAALQNRRGELDALRHVSETTWNRLTPLLQVVGPRTPKPALTATSVADWVKRLASAAGPHPSYLDVVRLNPTLPVTGTNGEDFILRWIYAQARKRQMRLVPVVRVGETSAEHLQLARDAALEDGHGLALRYRMRSVLPPPGMSQTDYLAAQLSTLGESVDNVDLIVDLGYLDEDDELDPGDVAAALDEMSAVGSWRAYAMIGTSIPKMMSCVKEGTLGAIPRREWELWSQLVDYGLNRVPAFGDYAVQHPEPPADNGGGNTRRANVRYTTATDTLVVRGFGPESQEGKDQYHGLCEQLVAHNEFAGAQYSWGDEVIKDCADGSLEPGSQTMWRGAGTSHHLRLVTDQVRQRTQRGRGGGSAVEPGADPD